MAGSINIEDFVPGSVRRELISAVIKRIRDEIGKISREVCAPEAESPKAAYEVRESLDEPYANRDGAELEMDVFEPVVPETHELPVIVLIHGGGLVLDDRSLSRNYARSLAARGYLVFSIEYRLAPEANVCEQLDDVCAGMDQIGRRLVDFNVDFTRMFLTAESAGAYLAVYVAAMKKSEKLQKAIGYEPSRMVFKALGLHSGMFYIDRCDPVGWLLGSQIYGSKEFDREFKQYLDPEHKEITGNLPPVFLSTARGDFLNNYTLMFHDAMKKADRESYLVYYGDDSLGHSFPVLQSHRVASIEVIDRMTDWFEQQAAKAAAAKQ